MPQFFFHMATPAGRDEDDIGIFFPSAEHAMVEAWRAVPEITSELVRSGQSPASHRFEICDEAGALVFELPFNDVLGAPPAPSGAEVIQSKLAATIARSRTLQDEFKAVVADVQATLRTTRDLLALRD